MTTLPHTMNYRDLAHASYHSAIHKKIQESLEIIDNVNSLLKEVSEVYGYFSEKLTSVFKKFNNSQMNFTYSPEIHDLWNIILQYFSEEAKIYNDVSENLDSLVCKPLKTVSIHKKSQGEKLYDFRCSVEILINDESDLLESLHKEYIDQYLLQREKYDSKLIPGLLNAHNRYVLQLISVNKMKDQYHSQALPCVLDELENIQKEIIQIFQSRITNNSEYFMKKHRSLCDNQEQLISFIKEHPAPEQIMNFVKQLNSNQAVAYWRREQFLPPDGDCPEILARDDIISDKLTDDQIFHNKANLMKEQNELLSFISQNEDVLNTLKALKTNGMTYSKSFEKLFELEDDICRKQNEVRMAQIQVSGIVAQVQHIDCKRVTNNLCKDDEGSGVKKIWKKAVFSLKRDKGSKHQSIFKNIKKESFRPASSTLQNAFQHDDAKIDPVYHLLRSAATKGNSPNNQYSMADMNSSPTPKYNEMAFQGTNGRLSLIQAAFNMATLSRRRLLLTQSKNKSSSVDDSGPPINRKSPPRSPYQDSESSEIKETYYHRASMPQTIHYSASSTPTQIHKETKYKNFLFSKTIEDSAIPKSISKICQSNQKYKISERMKSFSLDNSDNLSEKNHSPTFINTNSKRMSSSYTNTNSYESNVPLSPRRRKHLYGRNKSLSLDQEDQASHRRVAFDEESLIRKQSGHLENSEKQFKNSTVKSRRSSSQIRNLYDSWRVKSFSLDIPDTVSNSNVDTNYTIHSSKLSLLAPSTPNGCTPSHSPKHDAKRLDRISESLEKNLSTEIDTQVEIFSSINQKVLKYQKGHVDDTSSKNYSKIHGYRLSGNLYVVLYDFWGRQKDELQLRAGWKVSAIDISDSDWWTGKCNGKFGFFPANYVQAIHQGEHVWRVVREITSRDSDENPIRLYKNQILIQTGSQDNDQVLIRTKTDTTFWCPVDCVTRVIDSYS